MFYRAVYQYYKYRHISGPNSRYYSESRTVDSCLWLRLQPPWAYSKITVKSITKEYGINGCLVCDLWLSDGLPTLDSRVWEGVNLAVIPLSITPPCKIGNSRRKPWHSTKDFPGILLFQTTTQPDKQWVTRVCSKLVTNKLTKRCQPTLFWIKC